MEKIDHAASPGDGNGAPLSRQVTITLSPEQYERMFFQPEPPRHGDYAKRFGTLRFRIRPEAMVDRD